ncbi:MULTISPECIES: recombinase family protein [Vibrio]|uniref:recombinase family protein n=1 Tax=Vibrio TaxID=662 RepID=UPI0019D45475|nr:MULTISPECIES: recombinase family protein [Vibrio]MBN8105182.1 recombinase family protein [Vibrio vulnificus]MDW2326979.1 recombinase family protein [Vibrio sp. 1401]
MTESKKRYAVTYQRFSSDRQVGNSSIDRQTNSQKDWLRANPDVVVIDSFVDQAMSAWSGKHIEKGSLGKLLQAAEEGIIQPGTLVLVEHFSRLTRQNFKQARNLMDRLWEAGITVVTVRDKAEYPPEAANDMNKQVRLLVEIQQAFSESQWRSEKVKASYSRREKQAREQGIVPRIRKPFWINDDGTLNHLHQAIKDMFHWYRNGMGQQRIVVALREKYPDTAIQKINPSTVMRWIQADITRGFWRGNRIYEAAIDDAIFYEVQSIHKNRLYENVKPDRKWPLSGLMKCGVCGRGMSIQKSKNSAPVVRCSSKQRDRSCNRKTTFPYFITHIYMTTVVRKYALRKYSTLTSNKELQQQLHKIESELIKSREYLIELNEFLEQQRQAGKRTFATLSMIEDEYEKIEELEEKENEIKASLETLSKGSISREARELVLSPENYNLEMHKLGFRIVVDEHSLSTEGFDEKVPTLEYLGYSRKTKNYEYRTQGTPWKEEWPASAATEELLMMKGLKEKVQTEPFMKKIWESDN